MQNHLEEEEEALTSEIMAWRNSEPFLTNESALSTRYVLTPTVFDNIRLFLYEIDDIRLFCMKLTNIRLFCMKLTNIRTNGAFL